MSRRYLAFRLAQLLATAAGIIVAAFLLIQAVPGDPVFALAGEHGDPAYYAFMRERFGLDQPAPLQLLTYAQRVLTGDFGISFVQGQPAAAIILERVPATLLLTLTAQILSLGIGLSIGIFTARRPRTPADLIVAAMTLTLQALPVFFLGHVAILALSVHFGLFPVQGMTTAGSGDQGFARALDIAHHLFLPALVLATQEVAAVARLTRSGLGDELERDHIRTARAKGLTERVVLWRHAMPRVLLSLVTLVGARTGQLLAGAAVVEIVFGWPGIGRLLFTALQTRDTPVLLGLFFVISLAVLLANLVTDALYASLDPRVRYR